MQLDSFLKHQKYMWNLKN